jgi:predicted transcriptional regulator
MEKDELMEKVMGDSPCAFCFGTGRELNSRAGKILQTARKENKVSQAEIAASLRVSRGYISLLETGERPWTTDLVQRYIESL